MAAVVPDVPVVQHESPWAHPADRAQVVADDDDGGAFPLQRGHALEAPQLKGDVAHREHLVDEQHVGLGDDRDREAEPHEHARRVELHGSVDERGELGERNDLVEPPIDLLTGHAEHGSADVDVLAPRELVMEADADGDERSDVAAHHHASFGRTRDAGQHPQQCRLAGPVATYHAQALAGLHREVRITYGPQCRPLRAISPVHQVAEQHRGVVVLHVALAGVLDDDDAVVLFGELGRAHSKSTITRS
jgi:hypothetical protein